MPERHSLTRFPQRIFRLYRRLALLFALPLSYGLTILIGVSGIAFLVIFMEIGVLEFSVADLFFTLANVLWLMTLVMLASWIGRGIYSIAGLIAVQILGHRLARIEQEQPIHMAIDSNGIRIYSDWGSEQTSQTTGMVSQRFVQQSYDLVWEDVTEYISMDFMIRQQPIYLISRTILKAGSQILMVEGMTAGYESFKRDIQNALLVRVPTIKVKNHNFTFLEKWSTLATMLFSLILATILYLVGRIKISIGKEPEIPLPVSTIVTFAALTLIPTTITVICWRLWRHRIQLEKDVEYRDTVVPTWLILVAAILSFLIALGWILLQALIL